MHKPSTLLLTLFLISLQALPAQNLNRLDRAVRYARCNPSLRHASLSICLRDIQSDTTLYFSDPDIALHPADLNKLFTSAAAYEFLGPEFRFSTTLEYSGYIEPGRGILHGNLYVCGNGDPLIGSPDYRQMRRDSVFASLGQRIRLAGIRHITGHVYVDGTAYPDESAHPSWQWGDIGNYYGAGASGFNYHNNFVEVHLAAGKREGDPAIIRSHYPDCDIVNHIVTGSADTMGAVSFYGTPDGTQRCCRGVLPLGTVDTVVWASLPSPGLFFAREFTTYLRQVMSIPVTGDARIVGTEGRNEKTVAIESNYLTAPLREIYRNALFDNINTVAESLFKQLGLQKMQQGTYHGGYQAMRLLFGQMGLNDTAIRLVDGSGLSRDNLVTADFICQFLDTFASQPCFADYYDNWDMDSYATLFPRKPKNCIIKYRTGAAMGVRNIAGYIHTPRGRAYAFAILCNNYNCPSDEIDQILEDIMEQMARL